MTRNGETIESFATLKTKNARMATSKLIEALVDLTFSVCECVEVEKQAADGCAGESCFRSFAQEMNHRLVV